MTAVDHAEFLKPTPNVDSDSLEVRAFTVRALGDASDMSEKAKAIRLFDAVRDDIRYDPYRISFRENDYRASVVAQQDAQFCVPKAVLLTAVLRAAGIPAAVGFADVKNHLTSPKLFETMGTDLFMYHGYVSLWLDGKMFKVTPAFNSELCDRFGVKPLTFDGKSDALFHEFDNQNRRHMEYTLDRGWFADPPIRQMLEDFRVNYPGMWARQATIDATADAAFRGSAKN